MITLGNSRAVAVATVLLLVAGIASADLVMNYKQDGDNVVMTLKGSLNIQSWPTTFSSQSRGSTYLRNSFDYFGGKYFTLMGQKGVSDAGCVCPPKEPASQRTT